MVADHCMRSEPPGTNLFREVKWEVPSAHLLPLRMAKITSTLVPER